jgi:N6-adenosine-specific RNA methylase IME4
VRLNGFVPLPEGPIDLAYRPWRWLSRSPKGDGNAPFYNRTSLQEHRGFPLTSVLARNAMVAAWVIDSHLWLAKEPFEGWGLRYSTVCFYWAKTTKHGLWHVGTGKVTMANPEQCWLLRRGNGLPIKDHGIRRLIVSQVREHSRNPDKAREGLERLLVLVAESSCLHASVSLSGPPGAMNSPCWNRRHELQAAS